MGVLLLLVPVANSEARPELRHLRILIVGAGFTGAVVARELAEAGLPSLVIDERLARGRQLPHGARPARCAVASIWTAHLSYR